MTTAREGARRTLAVLVATAACATGAAGCGSEAPPLEGITPVQRGQLVAAWTARIAATDGTAIAPEDRNARVTALYEACRPLDPTNPFLAAVAATCGPTAVREKLDVVLPARCSKPAAICVRALDRIAEATDGLSTTVVKVGEEARRVIADPECRAQFVEDEPRTKALGELASSYRMIALGVEQRDEDITALGQRRVAENTALIRAKGTAAQRTATFRTACGLGEG